MSEFTELIRGRARDSRSPALGWDWEPPLLLPFPMNEATCWGQADSGHSKAAEDWGN